jgi:hypothetical protein
MFIFALALISVLVLVSPLLLLTINGVSNDNQKA